MIDLIVLNEDLERIGIIDNYSSLIWANRYNEDGDCELYIQANTTNLNLLKEKYFLTREDDDMLCQIKKIELETDVETGNYIIVTGVDAKNITSQRIIWNTVSFDGKAEDYIYKLLNENMINPSNMKRKFKNSSGEEIFFTVEKNGFTEAIFQQVSYQNLEEKIKEICKTYGWGYKVFEDNRRLYFKLYKGTDRSDYVIFSNDFENLLSTKYKKDLTSLGNIALIGGEGEGAKRVKNVIGEKEGFDRFEIFVDARDLSSKIQYSELIETYPLISDGGRGSIKTVNSKYVYSMSYLDVPVYDENQLKGLKSKYPESSGNREITIDGILYYRIKNVVIADLSSASPEANDDVTLRSLVYSIFLLNRGYENLADYGTTETFEGAVEPNTTFVYKKDYFLGDLVTAENEYGISSKVRIVEVVETADENGYSIEPKFEYMEVN